VRRSQPQVSKIAGVGVTRWVVGRILLGGAVYRSLVWPARAGGETQRSGELIKHLPKQPGPRTNLRPGDRAGLARSLLTVPLLGQN
jgi:hypothetical protein